MTGRCATQIIHPKLYYFNHKGTRGNKGRVSLPSNYMVSITFYILLFPVCIKHKVNMAFLCKFYIEIFKFVYILQPVTLIRNQE